MGISREKLVAKLLDEDRLGNIDIQCLSTAFINKLHMWIAVQIKGAVDRAVNALDNE